MQCVPKQEADSKTNGLGAARYVKASQRSIVPHFACGVPKAPCLGSVAEPATRRLLLGARQPCRVTRPNPP
jgi:hypothetical protein